VFVSTPAHSALIFIVTLFEAIGPPALWLVGNTAYGEAIRLLGDTMTIAELTPPSMVALEREPSPAKSPTVEEQPEDGTDPLPEAP
jgi:hypothetical protein